MSILIAYFRFPACIGCVDCVEGKWKNCPKELQGIMTGRGFEPEVRTEVIFNLDLWISECNFSFLGGSNVLNIVEISSRFSRVVSGLFPSVTSKYKINDNYLFMVLLFVGSHLFS